MATTAVPTEFFHNKRQSNSDKFQFIIFSDRSNTNTEIVFRDVAIPASTSFTLLGVDINIVVLDKSYQESI